MTETTDAAAGKGSRLLVPIAAALLVVATSVATVLRYAGPVAAAAYAVAVPALFILAWEGYRRNLFPFVPDRDVRIGVALAILVLFLAFLWIHPLANPQVRGFGSTRDDAIAIGARELLAGRNPYLQRTYDYGDLSPMPGAFLLAIPFLLLGNVAYQNFVWLWLGFLTASRALASPGWAAAWWFAVLLPSPVLWMEYATGGDLLANTLYVLTFALGLVHSTAMARRRAPWAWAALLGIGLASRANFWLLVPALWGFLRARHGWRRATGWLAVSGVVLALLVVPTLWMPEGFDGPLTTQQKYDFLRLVSPTLEYVVPVVVALISLSFAWPGLVDSLRRLLGASAVVQAAWPSLLVGLLFLGAPRAAQFLLREGYLVPALALGVLAFAHRLSTAPGPKRPGTA